jgi:uncharacterized membrane protein YhaH (DUF805 family)
MKNSPPNPTIKWVLLSWQGRLSRSGFFWAAALLLIAQVFLFVKGAGLDSKVEQEMLVLGFGGIFLWLASAWALFAMSIKRLHDIGQSGNFAICVFIPFISLLFLLAMMIIPGSQETNKHGLPPFPKIDKNA